VLGASNSVRHAREHLRHLFPYVPGQAGYNKRLRKSADQLQVLIRLLATETDLWADGLWLIDSTPVECGRSRPTAKRSRAAEWAGYGYWPATPATSGGCACT
jgi:hypothetical protein